MVHARWAGAAHRPAEETGDNASKPLSRRVFCPGAGAGAARKGEKAVDKGGLPVAGDPDAD